MDEQVVMKTAPEYEWIEMEETIQKMSHVLNEKDKILERYILRINKIGAALDAMDGIDLQLTRAKELIGEFLETKNESLEDLQYRMELFLIENTEKIDEESRKANDSASQRNSDGEGLSSAGSESSQLDLPPSGQ